MAGRADNERLAPHFRHQGGPGGLCWPRFPEVGEFADLVGLHCGPLMAPFTFAFKEPDDQFFGADGWCWLAVVDDRAFLPFERDAAEPCDQWFPARPLYAGLETRAWPVPGDGDGLVLTGHLRHLGAVLAGERLEHGCLCRPPQPVQRGHVPGE